MSATERGNPPWYAYPARYLSAPFSQHPVQQQSSRHDLTFYRPQGPGTQPASHQNMFDTSLGGTQPQAPLSLSAWTEPSANRMVGPQGPGAQPHWYPNMFDTSFGGPQPQAPLSLPAWTEPPANSMFGPQGPRAHPPWHQNMIDTSLGGSQPQAPLSLPAWTEPPANSMVGPQGPVVQPPWHQNTFDTSLGGPQPQVPLSLSAWTDPPANSMFGLQALSTLDVMPGSSLAGHFDDGDQLAYTTITTGVGHDTQLLTSGDVLQRCETNDDQGHLDSEGGCSTGISITKVQGATIKSLKKRFRFQPTSIATSQRTRAGAGTWARLYARHRRPELSASVLPLPAGFPDVTLVVWMILNPPPKQQGILYRQLYKSTLHLSKHASDASIRQRLQAYLVHYAIGPNKGERMLSDASRYVHFQFKKGLTPRAKSHQEMIILPDKNCPYLKKAKKPRRFDVKM